MSRRRELCKAMPDWMLRQIAKWPCTRAWKLAADLELWHRSIEGVIAEASVDEDSGPWAVDAVRGRQ